MPPAQGGEFLFAPPGAVDHAAAQHHLAVVEGDRLAGRGGPLRLVKPDAQGTRPVHPNRRRRLFTGVAHARRHPERAIRRRPADPVPLARRDLGAEQVVFLAHDPRVARRVDTRAVARSPQGDPQTAALSDGKAGEPAVRTDLSSAAVQDRPGPGGLRAPPGPYPPLIVPPDQT